jgi:hypothetical protein
MEQRLHGDVWNMIAIDPGANGGIAWRDAEVEL